MRDEDKWPAIHAYRKAVVMGRAPAIRCPDCDSELVPASTTASNTPVLRCLSCRAIFTPGLRTWEQIAENISEVVQTFKDEDFD